MEPNTIVYFSAFVVLALICGALLYVNIKQDLRYCDTLNIKTDYTGEKLCYEKPIYQGAVRPTDDEEYFRKTGKTIPLEVKK